MKYNRRTQQVEAFSTACLAKVDQTIDRWTKLVK